MTPPDPGTEEAFRSGCRCSVPSNFQGVRLAPGAFLRKADCPLHGWTSPAGKPDPERRNRAHKNVFVVLSKLSRLPSIPRLSRVRNLTQYVGRETTTLTFEDFLFWDEFSRRKRLRKVLSSSEFSPLDRGGMDGDSEVAWALVAGEEDARKDEGDEWWGMRLVGEQVNTFVQGWVAVESTASEIERETRHKNSVPQPRSVISLAAKVRNALAQNDFSFARPPSWAVGYLNRRSRDKNKFQIPEKGKAPHGSDPTSRISALRDVPQDWLLALRGVSREPSDDRPPPSHEPELGLCGEAPERV